MNYDGNLIDGSLVLFSTESCENTTLGGKIRETTIPNLCRLI
jgi:hypothetical protein